MPDYESRNLLNALPEPVLVIAPDRQITVANGAALNLFGPNLVGQNFDRVIRHPECLRAIDAVLAGEENAEASFSLPVPVRTTLRVKVERLKASKVFENGLVVSFRDISHVVEAEQMRSDFVANVSHELRSPLTALNGFIETLKGPAKNDEATREKFLDIMGREAGRMNRLIGDLLSLSKVEVNEHVRPTGDVDVFAVLQRVVAQLQPLAEEVDVAIELPQPGFETSISGDDEQLVQVFQNLIENAIKYGSSGEKVTVFI